MMLLPVRDYDTFLADNKPSTEGGEQRITGKTGDVYVVAKVGGWVALAEKAELLAALGKPARPLSAVLTAEQKELSAASGLWIHANFAGVFALMRPRIDKELQSPAGEDVAVRAVFELLSAIGEDGESLDLGLVVDRGGLEFRVLATAKADSATAKAFASMPKPAGPLTVNVPLADYLVAWGSVPMFGQGEFADHLQQTLAKVLGRVSGDAEASAVLVEQADKLLQLSGRVSGSITATAPAGREPTFPLVIAKTAEVSDGPAALAQARAYVRQFVELTNKQTRPDVKPGEAPGPPLLTFTEAAEQIEGVAVDTLVVNSNRLEGFDSDTAGLTSAMLGLGGAEPITVRMGLADAKHLVSTVGGGKAGFATVLKAVASQTSLQADAGAAKVAGRVLPGRAFEMYIAADRAMGMVVQVLQGMQSLFGGVTVPPFPQVNTPVALSVSFSDRAASARLFVSKGIISAVEQWVDQLAAAQSNAGVQRGPTAPPAP